VAIGRIRFSGRSRRAPRSAVGAEYAGKRRRGLHSTRAETVRVRKSPRAHLRVRQCGPMVVGPNTQAARDDSGRAPGSAFPAPAGDAGDRAGRWSTKECGLLRCRLRCMSPCTGMPSGSTGPKTMRYLCATPAPRLQSTMIHFRPGCRCRSFFRIPLPSGSWTFRRKNSSLTTQLMLRAKTRARLI